MLLYLLVWLGFMCCRSWSTEPRLTTGRPPNQNDATDPNSWCRLTRNSCRLPLFTMSCRLPSLREQKAMNLMWTASDVPFAARRPANVPWHWAVILQISGKLLKMTLNNIHYLTHICFMLKDSHFVILLFYLNVTVRVLTAVKVKMTTYFSSVGLRPGMPEALLDDWKHD